MSHQVGRKQDVVSAVKSHADSAETALKAHAESAESTLKSHAQASAEALENHAKRSEAKFDKLVETLNAGLERWHQRTVAAVGLPERWIDKKLVEIARRKASWRFIVGETFVVLVVGVILGVILGVWLF